MRHLLPAFSCVLVAVAGCQLPDSPSSPGTGGGIFPPGYAANVFSQNGVTSASARVVPVSGGTLTVLADDNTAVAADPDRDQVYVVDLGAGVRLHTVQLAAGSEPGRVVEDAAHRAHVVLRSGHGVATIDPATGTLLFSRTVCPTPRGIAYRAAGDELLVACLGGELVRLPAAGGSATATTVLDSDLRDVVVAGSDIYVTRFRAAEVLLLNTDLTLRRRIPLPGYSSSALRSGAQFSAMVAYRAVALPDGTGIAVSHQRGQDTLVGSFVSPGYYTQDPSGGGPGAIVHGTVTVVKGGVVQDPGPPIGGATLPVDVAYAQKGGRMAMIFAGNIGPIGYSDATYVGTVANLPSAASYTYSYGQRQGNESQPVAVAFFAGGTKVAMQSREPAFIAVADAATVDSSKTQQGYGSGGFLTSATKIDLGADSRFDTGHLIFHSNSSSTGGVACAACHAEGGEDGHTWSFAEGVRRTPDLRGGIKSRAPYHWDGQEKTIRALSDDVFTKRMSGPPLSDDELGTLTNWLDKVPHLAAQNVADTAAVARGKALYASLQCSTCHDTGSPTFKDVNTGGMFKAPGLTSVALRLPVLHDGCAKTLADRFGTCGGGNAHGSAGNLPAAQISDLVAYLSSL